MTDKHKRLTENQGLIHKIPLIRSEVIQCHNIHLINAFRFTLERTYRKRA